MAAASPFVFVLMSFAYLHGARQVYATTTLFPFLEPSTLSIVILAGIPQLLLLSLTLAILLVALTVSIVYVVATLLTLSEITLSDSKSAHGNSFLTASKLRTPPTSLFNYKCLQLVSDEVNHVGRHLYPIISALLIIQSTVINTTVIL